MTQTSISYFEDYEAVTSGDYSYHRGAALFVEGATGPSFRDSLFRRVDGNALFFSNFVRNASVLNSEFAFTGNDGITMIGSTEQIDGTGGDQPRFSTISQNLLHEIGVYQKQATPIWQSLACASNISNNVVFNVRLPQKQCTRARVPGFHGLVAHRVVSVHYSGQVPRAAINFNDGASTPRYARSRSPQKSGVQAVTLPGSPGYALHPSERVALVQMDRPHPRANPAK